MLEHTLGVTTWNLNGALSDPLKVDAALDKIGECKSSVIVLPDAWRENTEQSLQPPRKLELLSADDFRLLGYTVMKSTFREDRSDDDYARYGFMTLVRHNFDVDPQTKVFRIGERPIHHVRYDLGETALNVIGLYLNDQSEENRNIQLDEFLHYIEPYRSEPMILAGDFNAMHRNSRPAQILNSSWMQPLSKLPIMNNTPRRLIEMAEGATMAILTENDFIDADPQYAPTMPSRWPLFQLDHIMTRNGFSAPLFATPTELTKYAHISDHLMASSVTTLDVSRLKRR